MDQISGIVQKGQQRGARLGFPTANIPLVKKMPGGIYCGEVELKVGTEVGLQGKAAHYKAAIYVNPAGTILEAHLLDFPGGDEVAEPGVADLYGKTIIVAVFGKIRESIHFETEEALKAAIQKDVEFVYNYKT